MMMVEAIIQPSKFEAVKDALMEVGVRGMTVAEVRGFGTEKGRPATYRGATMTNESVQRLRLQIAVSDRQMPAVRDAIQRAAHTGSIGDGKLFIYPINEVIRIRTRDKGEAAL